MRNNTNTQSNQQSRQMLHNQVRNIANISIQRSNRPINNSTQITNSRINNRQSNNRSSLNNNPLPKHSSQEIYQKKYPNQTSFINTNQNPFLPDSFPFFNPSFGSQRTDTNQHSSLNSNLRPDGHSSRGRPIAIDNVISGLDIIRRNTNNNRRLNTAFILYENERDSLYYDVVEQKMKKMKEVIKNSLPDFYIKDLTNLDEEKTHCCICLSVFTTDIKVVSLPCLHLYHKDCIVDWFEKHNTCPLCKMVISENSFK